MREHHPEPPPVDVDGVLAMSIGTAIWGAAFFIMLFLREYLFGPGHEWWLWTCLAGVVLGLIGLGYCLFRRTKVTGSVRQPTEQGGKSMREPSR